MDPDHHRQRSRPRVRRHLHVESETVLARRGRSRSRKVGCGQLGAAWVACSVVVHGVAGAGGCQAQSTHRRGGEPNPQVRGDPIADQAAHRPVLRLHQRAGRTSRRRGGARGGRERCCRGKAAQCAHQPENHRVRALPSSPDCGARAQGARDIDTGDWLGPADPGGWLFPSAIENRRHNGPSPVARRFADNLPWDQWEWGRPRGGRGAEALNRLVFEARCAGCAARASRGRCALASRYRLVVRAKRARGCLAARRRRCRTRSPGRRTCGSTTGRRLSHLAGRFRKRGSAWSLRGGAETVVVPVTCSCHEERRPQPFARAVGQWWGLLCEALGDAAW